MTKQNAQITIHLSHKHQQTIQDLAEMQGISASEWMRNLAERELENIYQQAYNTLKAMRRLENDEI